MASSSSSNARQDASPSPGPALSRKSSLTPLIPNVTERSSEDCSIVPAEFQRVVDDVKAAISQGIYPTRIVQGSSGSYFCRNRQGEIVGVFKPKNEEPYGKLNPKWTKWLHRTCCPCFFGRSCLIPNLGYISEAAASVVDRMLKLDIVPKTYIISLASPTFSYSYIDRQSAARSGEYPEKIGSFQIFVKGYMDASKFLREGPAMLRDGRLPQDTSTGGLSSTLQTMFQDQFERMVILDYIIRNTDRGLDNWLVKYSEPETKELKLGLNNGKNAETSSEEDDVVMVAIPRIYIAAIDNGLAFPYKHPDQWRSYPYGWSYLPASLVSFSHKTRDLILPLINSKAWWTALCQQLRQVFSKDADFDEKMFKRQMAVMRGQIYNLSQVLSGKMENESPAGSPTNPDRPLLLNKGSPMDLISLPPCLIWEDEDVRDLTTFGKEFKDGVFATIIGGIESLGKRPSAVADSSTHSPKEIIGPDGKHVYFPHSNHPSYSRRRVEEEIEEGREELPQDVGTFLAPQVSTQAISAASSKRKKHVGPFRGRIITFVKSQPWFKSW